MKKVSLILALTVLILVASTSFPHVGWAQSRAVKSILQSLDIDTLSDEELKSKYLYDVDDDTAVPTPSPSVSNNQTSIIEESESSDGPLFDAPEKVTTTKKTTAKSITQKSSSPTKNTSDAKLSEPEITILAPEKTPAFTVQFPEINNQLSVDVSPETPGPNQDVTISLESYTFNINSSQVKWFINDKLATEGTGLKNFTFNTGVSGSKTIVSLKITPKEGKELVQQFTFSPISVDLMWQANTYTPPFYRGKALFSPESEVTFIALPNITNNGSIDDSDAIYRWSEDYRVKGDKSGFGANTFLYKAPIIIKPVTIQANSYSANNPRLKGVGTVTIEPFATRGIFYEDHPIYGLLLNRALVGSASIDRAEKRITVMPFYFSGSNKNLDMTYKWSIGSVPLDIPVYQNGITVRKTEASEGRALVTVDITNEKNILQTLRAGINVLYAK